MTDPTDPAQLLQQAKSGLVLDENARERLLQDFTHRLDVLAIGPGVNGSHSLARVGKTLSFGKLSVAVVTAAVAGAAWYAFEARTVAPAREPHGMQQSVDRAVVMPSLAQAPPVQPTPPRIATQLPTATASADANASANTPLPQAVATPAAHTVSGITSGVRRARAASPPRSSTSTSAAAGRHHAGTLSVVDTAINAAESAPSSAPVPKPTTPKPSAPPVAADLLGAELRLIQSASRALAAARPRDALEALARHETLYGSGGLAEERDGLTALAQCAAGDVQAARKSASGFLHRYPKAALAERVRSAAQCAPHE